MNELPALSSAARRIHASVAAGLLGLLASASQAAPIIDFGAASQYSAFIFGDVKAANDIEGRMAVGGNLTAQGLSVGYRTPNGLAGPALVVGGDVRFTNGRIYANAPASVLDTTLGEGNQPVWDPALSHYGNGYGVFGGRNLGSAGYLDLRGGSVASVVDFTLARAQLTALSSSLARESATGTAQRPWSDIDLVGRGRPGDVEVFNLTLTGNGASKVYTLPSLNLRNVDAESWVVINVLNEGEVQLTGGMAGLKALQEAHGRVVFNFANARKVKVGTWVDGNILAPKADLYGQGHVEGTVIGQSISQAFEIGWEPPTTPPKPPRPDEPSKVPEPGSLALVLAALAAAAGVARRVRRR